MHVVVVIRIAFQTVARTFQQQQGSSDCLHILPQILCYLLCQLLVPPHYFTLLLCIFAVHIQFTSIQFHVLCTN
jgi:hypothetical protein